PPRPTARPATRSAGQSASISPTRKAIRSGGSNHSTGSNTGGTYQRQPLTRSSVADGLDARQSSAITATRGPLASRARDDSRNPSLIGRSNRSRQALCHGHFGRAVNRDGPGGVTPHHG